MANFENKNQVEVNESLMTKIVGGKNSAGYVCSLSGECNNSGDSCWDWVDDVADVIKGIFG